MTDELFTIIEVEAKLAVSAILKRHGIAHEPERIWITVPGVPIEQLPETRHEIVTPGTEITPPVTFFVSDGHPIGLTFHSPYVVLS